MSSSIIRLTYQLDTIRIGILIKQVVDTRNIVDVIIVLTINIVGLLLIINASLLTNVVVYHRDDDYFHRC